MGIMIMTLMDVGHEGRREGEKGIGMVMDVQKRLRGNIYV
jgi:hypothetical protein